MKILEEQILELKKYLNRRYPSVSFEISSDYPERVILKNVPLPDGYNKKTSMIIFEVPPGYPFAIPDSFYTDSDLRLSYGGFPPDINTTKIALNWYHRLETWSPEKDTLVTFFNTIMRKLQHEVEWGKRNVL